MESGSAPSADDSRQDSSRKAESINPENGSSPDLASETISKPTESVFQQGRAQLGRGYRKILDLAKLATETSPVDAGPNIHVLPVTQKELFAKIDLSLEFLKALSQAWEGYRTITSDSCGRPLKATAQFAELCQEYRLFFLGRSAASRGNVSLKAEIETFCQVLINNGSRFVDEGGSLRPLSRLFGVRDMNGKFAHLDAFNYLEHSPSLRDQAALLLKNLEALKEVRTLTSGQIKTSLRENVPTLEGEQSFEKVAIQIASAIDTSRKLAQSATDIDLNKIPELLNSLYFRVSIRPEVLDVLRQSMVSFGLAIRAIIEDTPIVHGKSPSLQMAEPFNQTEGERKRLIIRNSESPFLLPSGHHQRVEFLAKFSDYYLTVRDLLFASYAEYAAEHPSDDRIRNIIEPLRADLSSPLGSSSGARILGDLLALDAPALAPVRERFALARVYKGVVENIPTYSVMEPDYLPLLREFTRLLINVPEDRFTEIRQQTRDTPLEKALEPVFYIRELAQRQLHKPLAFFVDRELTARPRDVPGHTRYAALLFAIESLTEMPDIVRNLKFAITKREAIRTVESELSQRLKSETSLRYVSSAVERITQRMNPTLVDYLGDKVLIETIRTLYEENLRLRTEPSRYQGFHPKLAIFNAVLLYGPAGSGKTYLVDCLANQFGYERIKISREEMERESSAPSKVPVRSYNSDLRSLSRVMGDAAPTEANIMFSRHITKYLNTRIDELKEKMRKSHAPGGIIFIDELEAEFRKRDPSTADTDEIERTNIMLRVIETAMENNLEIDFIGATNHIDMVDSAAYRLGRFGIKFRIGNVTEAGATEFIGDMLRRSGLDEKEFASAPIYPEFVRESVGVTPLLLQSAMVRSYALREGSNAGKVDYQVLAEMFLRSLKNLKMLTSIQGGEAPVIAPA